MSNLNIYQFQWAVVGDTNPVGCQFSDKIVFSELCKASSDYGNPLYSTKYGIYGPNCGLKNVLMSFGHDGEQIMLLLYVYIVLNCGIIFSR